MRLPVVFQVAPILALKEDVSGAIHDARYCKNVLLNAVLVCGNNQVAVLLQSQKTFWELSASALYGRCSDSAQDFFSALIELSFDLVGYDAAVPSTNFHREHAGAATQCRFCLSFLHQACKTLGAIG